MDDIPDLQTLYRETITTVCAADYDAAQIQAWSSTVEGTDSLAKRIESQYFIVATSESGEIVGFASLEKPDYLDMMCVHKDYQFQGVGNSLLTAIREQAVKVSAAKIVRPTFRP